MRWRVYASTYTYLSTYSMTIVQLSRRVSRAEIAVLNDAGSSFPARKASSGLISLPSFLASNTGGWRRVTPRHVHSLCCIIQAALLFSLPSTRSNLRIASSSSSSATATVDSCLGHRTESQLKAPPSLPRTRGPCHPAADTESLQHVQGQGCRRMQHCCATRWIAPVVGSSFTNCSFTSIHFTLIHHDFFFTNPLPCSSLCRKFPVLIPCCTLDFQLSHFFFSSSALVSLSVIHILNLL